MGDIWLHKTRTKSKVQADCDGAQASYRDQLGQTESKYLESWLRSVEWLRVDASCCIDAGDPANRAYDVKAGVEDALHSQGNAMVPLSKEAVMWSFAILIEAGVDERC
ncbi:hypothetical protein NDU88_004414 [Pleurodeles waltl]|uniref:Uncharacterized protein n=1 Tax=Pleurodeles waltl TaxID=8319 RepID=A0AAV7T9B0_PLEWA|nr:hypothetical protein NDU88_004414 [Pleurodeles waltl]